MKLYTDIKSFINKVLSSGSGLSSKRAVGFGSFLLLSASVIVHLSGGITVAEFIWYGLIGLIIACFGLNTVISNKSMSIKSKIASDIVEKEPGDNSADDAKDVLNSNKP